MLRSTLKVKMNSNQEMKDYTENDMIRLKNMYQNLKNSGLQEKINCFLLEKEEGWFEQILFLLNKEEYRLIKGLSDELIILNNLCEICNKEYSATGQTTIEKFSSLEMIKKVYQEMIFYLRRMEFDMEDEVCKGFLALMSEWDFSIDYIKMVLEKGAIHNKDYTGNRLAQMLRENGYIEYSKQLLSDLD